MHQRRTRGTPPPKRTKEGKESSSPCSPVCHAPSVVSGSWRPCGLQPTRLVCPWILQASMLEWLAVPFSRESSQPRDRTHTSSLFCTVRWVRYHWCHLESPASSQLGRRKGRSHPPFLSAGPGAGRWGDEVARLVHRAEFQSPISLPVIVTCPEAPKAWSCPGVK